MGAPRVRDAVGRTLTHPAFTIGCSVGLALLPLSLMVPWHGKAVPAGLLFLAGMIVWLTGTVRARASAPAPLLLLAALAVGIDVLNALWHGLGWRPLDHAAHVLLYLGIAAVFVLPLNRRLVWAGIALAGAVIGLSCVVQHHVLGIDRAYGLNGGPSAAIACATVLGALALLAVARALRAGLPAAERVLHGLAAMLALYGALLTQSRGPLLATSVALIVQLVAYARASGRWRAASRFLLALALIGLAGVAATGGAILGRFDAIDQTLAQYDRHDAPGTGSIEDRLQMWQAALRAVKAHPLTGIGLDRYHAFLAAEIAAGRSPPTIARYNQPHNEYLRALVDGGVLQCLVLLGWLAIPAWWFMRRLGVDEESTAVASAGLGVVVLYACCSLIDSLLFRVMTQSLYLFVVLGLGLWLAAHRPAVEEPAR